MQLTEWLSTQALHSLNEAHCSLLPYIHFTHMEDTDLSSIPTDVPIPQLNPLLQYFPTWELSNLLEVYKHCTNLLAYLNINASQFTTSQRQSERQPWVLNLDTDIIVSPQMECDRDFVCEYSKGNISIDPHFIDFMGDGTIWWQAKGAGEKQLPTNISDLIPMALECYINHCTLYSDSLAYDVPPYVGSLKVNKDYNVIPKFMLPNDFLVRALMHEHWISAPSFLYNIDRGYQDRVIQLVSV